MNCKVQIEVSKFNKCNNYCLGVAVPTWWRVEAIWGQTEGKSSMENVRSSHFTQFVNKNSETYLGGLVNL